MFEPVEVFEPFERFEVFEWFALCERFEFEWFAFVSARAVGGAAVATLRRVRPAAVRR